MNLFAPEMSHEGNLVKDIYAIVSTC